VGTLVGVGLGEGVNVMVGAAEGEGRTVAVDVGAGEAVFGGVAVGVGVSIVLGTEFVGNTVGAGVSDEDTLGIEAVAVCWSFDRAGLRSICRKQPVDK